MCAMHLKRELKLPLNTENSRGKFVIIKSYDLTTLGSRVENSPPPDQLVSNAIFIPRLKLSRKQIKIKRRSPSLRREVRTRLYFFVLRYILNFKIHYSKTSPAGCVTL